MNEENMDTTGTDDVYRLRSGSTRYWRIRVEKGKFNSSREDAVYEITIYADGPTGKTILLLNLEAAEARTLRDLLVGVDLGAV